MVDEIIYQMDVKAREWNKDLNDFLNETTCDFVKPSELDRFLGVGKGVVRNAIVNGNAKFGFAFRGDDGRQMYVKCPKVLVWKFFKA